ncbi:MAG: gamma-glutamylcyclotransferase family protein [Acidimicrobiales bacterium]
MNRAGRHRYFAYGSNLHRPQMAALAPAAVAMGPPARLVGWELFVTGYGVLSIRPAGPDAAVWGLVWSCAEADLAVLDRFEAVDDGLYERIEVHVDGPAVAYRATSEAEGRPRPGYLEASVLPPMRELGFPETYVARVEGWLASGTAGPAWVATPVPGQVFTIGAPGS